MHKAAFGVLLSVCLASSALARDAADDPFLAYESGQYAEAARAAEDALARDPDNSVWWALIGEARAKLDQHADAAEAFFNAAKNETDAERRSYLLRAQALQLVSAGRRDEARVVVGSALADDALEARSSLDWAMVAISAGDDAAAQAILADEALYSGFSRQSALDAGYSAKREGLDARAVRFFEIGLALDEDEPEPLSPAKRNAIRRETRELSRDWAFLLQAGYSSADRPIGPVSLPLGNDEAWQVGAEVSRRIGGWRNGRPVSVFARVFQSEFLSGDAATRDTTQGWVGIRYKPIASLNLNLEASRLVAIDDEALDDWSLRALVSGGRGLEPETGKRNWTYAHYYADASYLLDADVTYAVAEGRFGRSFFIDGGATTLTPYAVARADLDTGRIAEEAIGAGAGMSLRHWFDETETSAARGFIDLDVQARERIAGSERASGVMVTMTIGR
ncbi:bacteriophage N4 adsorption protein A [Qipengyuania sp. 1NDW9]|uniref:bacteriophage N4 adsorption protein A n=1 Tax=Qipengyuania xiapuensis TaxID=2867236 RepID=UPI001C86D2DC|nr:bacteriophage N4 adsorption protein A [Qipengyuania xiapuensis]MBX7491868.1 bacteriophage N4 adsorption protein A [Qipengyuania xiapuensis]